MRKTFSDQQRVNLTLKPAYCILEWTYTCWFLDASTFYSVSLNVQFVATLETLKESIHFSSGTCQVKMVLNLVPYLFAWERCQIWPCNHFSVELIAVGSSDNVSVFSFRAHLTWLYRLQAHHLECRLQYSSYSANRKRKKHGPGLMTMTAQRTTYVLNQGYLCWDYGKSEVIQVERMRSLGTKPIYSKSVKFVVKPYLY